LDKARESTPFDNDWNQKKLLKLIADMIRAHRVAVARGVKALVLKLSLFFSRQSTMIEDGFRLSYSNHSGNHHGAVVLSADTHEALWRGNIERVFRATALEFDALLLKIFQSTADISYAATLSLLGLIESMIGRARVNQRVRRLLQSSPGILETAKIRWYSLIHKFVREDKLDVAQTLAATIRKIDETTRAHIPTIARTEAGRAADEGRKQGLIDSQKVKTISVIGCQARERNSPQYRGESTCNIERVPIYDIDLLEFHPNHTGTIVPSEFVDRIQPPIPGLEREPGE